MTVRSIRNYNDRPPQAMLLGTNREKKKKKKTGRFPSGSAATRRNEDGDFAVLPENGAVSISVDQVATSEGRYVRRHGGRQRLQTSSAYVIALQSRRAESLTVLQIASRSFQIRSTDSTHRVQILQVVVGLRLRTAATDYAHFARQVRVAYVGK